MPFFFRILSAFSFSSFVCKPVIGRWSDKQGGKFRAPYIGTHSLGVLGGLVYFSANAFKSNSQLAVALILIGRLLGGMGAANTCLGYSYSARVLDKESLTRATSMLMMARLLGMSMAPAFNLLLDSVKGSMSVTSSFSVEFTPLNSVGLLLSFSNLLCILIIYCFLSEPASSSSTTRRHTQESPVGGWTFWKSLFCLDILVPHLSCFCYTASGQLLMTAMAPAASDALGWGPVLVSTLMGASSLVTGVAVATVMESSRRGVADGKLLMTGLYLSVLGFALMYTFWKNPTTATRFTVPVIIVYLAGPFVGSPTRSIYTRAVDRKSSLRSHQGTLQAMISMTMSFASFITPSITSTFILRTPEQVAASRNQLELTPFGMSASLLNVLTIVVFWYMLRENKSKEIVEKEGDETVALLPLRRDKGYQSVAV